jgi:peptidoglycan/xylan/chitin deacetylase (PgdA/CDA1 family)
MKLKFIKSILSYPLNLPGVFRFTESVFSNKNSGFICCWHDLSAEIFKKQVESLHPIEPIPLEDLIQRFKAGKSTKGCCALTLDDGVGLTVNDISKECITNNWPVTFYLPTDYVEGKVLPFQKIKFINKYLLSKEYEAAIFSKYFEKKKIKKIEIIKTLNNLIYFENAIEINKIINFFINNIDESKKKLLITESPKPVLWNEVEKLSKQECISFQSHGISHTAVSSLNENEIEFEMKKSRKTIESHTNKKVHSFCYPYGAEISIGKKAPEIAARHFSSAVTLQRGRLKNNNPFYLPRIGFYKEDAPSFVRMKTILT